MSTCWKCGRKLPGIQTECEPTCGSTHELPSAIAKIIEMMNENSRILNQASSRILEELTRRQALKNLPPDYEI